ncbi:MAG TPA: helix-turn-helix transcriptional regulator [Pseudonocardia sp.]|nr:helix-turn-helix transcriptional regulator [Pseudonocardia sp.]
MAEPAADAIRRSRVAANRGRQRELYGAPLGDRVRRLTATLGISQARLARALGLSPPMLSQLVSAHRVKIGDPAVLARILLLDQRCRTLEARPAPVAVDALLAEVSRAGWRWAGWERPAEGDPARAAPAPRPPDRRGRDGARTPADALRGVAEPARLTAAAAVLHPTFPELAELLRQAAGRPRPARAD